MDFVGKFALPAGDLSDSLISEFFFHQICEISLSLSFFLLQFNVWLIFEIDFFIL